MQGYSIHAADGDIGRVEEFYFDDQTWLVRYLVVRAGGLLLNREVLIVPGFIKEADRDVQILYTDLTKEQVKNSPGIETDRPVADQQEIEYYSYYGMNPYWGSGWEVAGAPAFAGVYPAVYELGTEPHESEAPREERGDPHLRSTKEVLGYHIHAADEEVGHVEDFVVDDEEWAIRYIVVDTRNWLPGKKVLLSPRWISRINWAEGKVHVDLTRDETKSAPEWDPHAPPDREYETCLYEHYGRSPYWVYR